MKIELVVSDCKSVSYTGVKLTALVNMEDFYRMLDGINPQILTNYIYQKMKRAK